MNQENVIPSKLQEVAGKRDHILTSEMATALSKSSQTLLKERCLKGHAYGIIPKKIGGQLLWPVADIAKLLNGEVAA